MINQRVDEAVQTLDHDYGGHEAQSQEILVPAELAEPMAWDNPPSSKVEFERREIIRKRRSVDELGTGGALPASRSHSQLAAIGDLLTPMPALLPIATAFEPLVSMSLSKMIPNNWVIAVMLSPRLAAALISLSFSNQVVGRHSLLLVGCQTTADIDTGLARTVLIVPPFPARKPR